MADNPAPPLQWIIADMLQNAAVTRKLTGIELGLPGTVGQAEVCTAKVFEAPAFVAGLEDVTVMGEAFKESSGHLGVAED